MISIQKYKNIKIGFFTYLQKVVNKAFIFKFNFLYSERVSMLNVLLSCVFLSVFFTLSFLIYFFYSKRNNKSVKKIKINAFNILFLKEQEFNPDISTDNWDLHKLRLKKFRRSQYKGLTFFVSSENRIYYLSEEGDKVYC